MFLLSFSNKFSEFIVLFIFLSVFSGGNLGTGQKNSNKSDDTGSLSVILVVILPVAQMFLLLTIIVLLRICYRKLCLSRKKSRKVVSKNVKSKNIIALSHLLIQNYDSQVPDEMDELLKLPGVGRKTANVVLSNCFGVPAIAVDTHVFRVSTRLGFSDKKDPLQVEQDLMKKISKKYWTDAHHAFIFHGRRVCKARNPMCELCSVQSYCKFYKKKKG